MSKLSHRAAQRHREACALVESQRALSEEEKLFVLEHWQESSTVTNVLDGAFFTPLGLAQDLSIELVGGRDHRIIDLAAGIGHLAFANRRLLAHRWNGEPAREFVCIERNPDYVRVGQRILPEATWICADIEELDELELPQFDVAISNPPYGAVSRSRTNVAGYRGRRFEYHALALASTVARRGVFLVPQRSAPFRYSGQAMFGSQHDDEYARFRRATGIDLESNCGIDTSYYDGQWRGVSPRVEVVLADFTAASETAVDEARTRS